MEDYPLLTNEKNKDSTIYIVDEQKERFRLKILKKIERFGYKRDAYIHAHCCSKFFFCWAYRTLKVNSYNRIS